MAIVFISPQKKQRMFFWGITMSLILFLIIISLVILFPEFLSKNQNIPPKVSFKPDIVINLDVLDSNKVKDLEPFVNLAMAFTYIVEDKKGKQIQGNISAVSKESAQNILEEANFKVISLKEMNIGRNEPFIAY